MSKSPSNDRLIREIQPMPEFVREAIRARGLTEKYEERPAYQRNDYLMWINGAKREGTKRSRLGQMLDELEAGGVYMRMKWNG
jgi:uncharacterized protein YdeI (YjbR/CyaY-like superfamily)